MALANQVHRVVFEDARGVTAGIADDRAAVGRGGVAGDPGELDGQAVGERHVSVEALHEHGMIRRGLVDLRAGRQRLARPRLVIPVAAADPASLRQARDVVAQSAGQVRLVLRRTQVDPDNLLGAADQVHVGVVEAGHDQLAAGIDDARPGACQALDVGRGPDPRDHLAADGQRLRDGFAASTVCTFAFTMMMSATQFDCASGVEADRARVVTAAIQVRRMLHRYPGHLGPVDLHQDHRHVVVLIGAADERFDLAEDALAQLAGLEMAVLLDDPAEPVIAEEIARGVHRLGDAIGVQHDDVTVVQRDLFFLEQLGELFRGAVDTQSEDHAVRDEDLCIRNGLRPGREGR